MIVLESIAFSQDLMHKYETHKIAKAVVIAEVELSKKQKLSDTFDPFESTS